MAIIEGMNEARIAFFLFYLICLSKFVIENVHWDLIGSWLEGINDCMIVLAIIA